MKQHFEIQLDEQVEHPVAEYRRRGLVPEAVEQEVQELQARGQYSEALDVILDKRREQRMDYIHE